MNRLLGFALLAGASGAAAQETEAPVPQTLEAQPQAGWQPTNDTMMPTGWFAMIGPTLALAFDRAVDVEFAVGGEISVVNLQDSLVWAGGYLDVIYSAGSDESRLSIGPEVGFGFAGIDGGYLLVVGGDPSPQHGFALRPMITIAVASLYFRSAWLLGPHPDWSGEIGLLLKFPIELD